MDRRQLGITLIAIALALVLGAGVALLATSGSDESPGTARGPAASTTRASTAPSAPRTTTSTTRAPIVTIPTRPPGTVVVIPEPPTTARAPRRSRPRASTTTAPPATLAPAATAAPPTTPPPTIPTTLAPAGSESTTAPTTAPTSTSTTRPVPNETGVSAHRIRLAVIADDPAVLDGARAWAATVNRGGGIAGRKVRLDLTPTGGTPDGYAAAAQAACTRDVAIVAGLSAFDADTSPLDCGIPDIPIEAIAPEHRAREATYPAFPRRTGIEPVGPYRYLEAALDGCCSQYVLVPDREPERAGTKAAIAGAKKVGFQTVATPEVPFDASDADYDSLAQDLLASEATFVSSGLGRDSTISLRRAAVGAGVADVSAWYCDARCYDTAFVTEGSAAVEGQYVAIETVPFGDRRSVPALRAYLAESARETTTPTYEGLRAYVAGLLAEQALRAASSGSETITRSRVLEALAGTHDFTGGGIVGPTDVGERAPTGCTVVLQVHSSRFARVEPARRGSLDCGPQNLVDLEE